VVLGGFGEWLGATLLGYGVSDTIKKGVADTNDPDCWACGYCDSGMAAYTMGMMSALMAASFFLILATFAKMPVSTTHAIVAGVLGMTLVGKEGMNGFGCLSWISEGKPFPFNFFGGLSGIIASWVISPVLSGCIATVIYKLTYYASINTRRPGSNALLIMPFCYSIAGWIVTFMILAKSKPARMPAPMPQPARPLTRSLRPSRFADKAPRAVDQGPHRLRQRRHHPRLRDAARPADTRGHADGQGRKRPGGERKDHQDARGENPGAGGDVRADGGEVPEGQGLGRGAQRAGLDPSVSESVSEDGRC